MKVVCYRKLISFNIFRYWQQQQKKGFSWIIHTWLCITSHTYRNRPELSIHWYIYQHFYRFTVFIFRQHFILFISICTDFWPTILNINKMNHLSKPLIGIWGIYVEMETVITEWWNYETWQYSEFNSLRSVPFIKLLNKIYEYLRIYENSCLSHDNIEIFTIFLLVLCNTESSCYWIFSFGYEKKKKNY